jgi:hypothetical protein
MAQAAPYKVLDLSDDEVIALTKLGAKIGTELKGDRACRYNSRASGKGPAVSGSCTGNYFARELYGENK